MAVFGAPVADATPAPPAIDAGLDLLERVERLVREGRVPATRLGIGLHAGPAVVGNIGSAQRKEYTVIGDVVNVASRVEALNKSARLADARHRRSLARRGRRRERDPDPARAYPDPRARGGRPHPAARVRRSDGRSLGGTFATAARGPRCSARRTTRSGSLSRARARASRRLPLRAAARARTRRSGGPPTPSPRDLGAPPSRTWRASSPTSRTRRAARSCGGPS